MKTITKKRIGAAGAIATVVAGAHVADAGALGVANSSSPYLVSGNVHGWVEVDTSPVSGLIVSGQHHHIQRSYFGWREVPGSWTSLSVTNAARQKTNAATATCGHLYRWHSKWTVTNQTSWSIGGFGFSIAAGRSVTPEWYNPMGSGNTVC
ncbi:MAG: hypothetical protein ACOYOQ_10465 [Microthrixaceae bacterium]